MVIFHGYVSHICGFHFFYEKSTSMWLLIPPLLNLHRAPVLPRLLGRLFAAAWRDAAGGTIFHRMVGADPRLGLRAPFEGREHLPKKRSNRWGLFKIWGAKSDILWMATRNPNHQLIDRW